MILDTFLYLFDGDTSKLQASEKEALDTDKKLNQELQKTDDLSSSLGDSFADLITTAAGALGAMVSFGALASGIAQTSEYVDNLAKTARLYGENANELAAYQEVVKKFGGDIGSFQGVIKKLNGDMNEFVTTGTTGILPFMQRLGVDMVDANGKAKTALDILPELAARFETMSKSESAGLGEKLGLDEATIRLLQEGKVGLDNIIARQKGLFSVTKEQIAVFENFNDSVDDTKTAFRGMYVQLGADVLPILQYFMEKLQVGIQFLTEHKDFVVGTFIALGTAITAYALPAIIKFGVAAFTAFSPFLAIGATIAAVAISIGLLYDDIMVFIDGGNSAFEGFLKWIGLTKDEIENVRNFFKNFSAEVSDMWSKMFTGLLGWLGMSSTEIDNLKETFAELGENIATIFSATTTIVGKWYSFLLSVFKGILNLAVSVGGGIYKAFEPLLWLFGKGIVGAIELAISGISKIANFSKKVLDFFGVDNDIDIDKKIEAEIPASKALSIAGNVDSDMDIDKKIEVEIPASKALNMAGSEPLNNINSNVMSNSRSYASSNSVTIDRIDIQTQATDADAIAAEIGSSLDVQLKQVTATYEDGIAG